MIILPCKKTEFDTKYITLYAWIYFVKLIENNLQNQQVSVSASICINYNINWIININIQVSRIVLILFSPISCYDDFLKYIRFSEKKPKRLPYFYVIQFIVTISAILMIFLLMQLRRVIAIFTWKYIAINIS